MTTFKCSATILYFLMMCLTINIVHADEKDDDFIECINQLTFAYENESCSNCFRHAVEHYKKTEYIPGTPDQRKMFERLKNLKQSQNSASTLDQSQNFASTSNSDQDQSFASNSDQNQSFASVNEQMYDLQGDTSLDLSSIDYNFDGLADFIRKDPSHNLFEGPMSSVPVVLDEQQLPKNYAMVYYVELERMAQGNNMYPPFSYCVNFFNSHPDCFDALTIFGNSAKMAAGVALTAFKLSECVKIRYVYDYMLHIRGKVQLRSPSKSASSFCKEIYNNSDWYLEYKGYK